MRWPAYVLDRHEAGAVSGPGYTTPNGSSQLDAGDGGLVDP